MLTAKDKRIIKRAERNIEKDIKSMIDRRLEEIGEHGAYWHYRDLSTRMAEAAMLVLRANVRRFRAGKGRRSMTDTPKNFNVDEVIDCIFDNDLDRVASKDYLRKYLSELRATTKTPQDTLCVRGQELTRFGFVSEAMEKIVAGSRYMEPAEAIDLAEACWCSLCERFPDDSEQRDDDCEQCADAVYETRGNTDHAVGCGGPLHKQVEYLARFIQENIPGEPSQSESAVNCAIRLLRRAYVK